MDTLIVLSMLLVLAFVIYVYLNVENPQFLNKFCYFMGFITFVGKVLLISSILFQAFILYHDRKEGDQFNKNLNSAIASCSCLSQYTELLQQHLRLAVVGLLFNSALILVSRCWTVKLPTLLGLAILFWLQHHGVSKNLTSLQGALTILDNVALWHSLGVFGAIIYLIGAQCTPCKNQNLVAATAPAESEPESKANDISQQKPNAESKGKVKRH